MASSQARQLVAGLCTLRAEGLLCDLVLVSGGERLLAHQVVLAAASGPFREYLVHCSQREPGPLELRLQGAEQLEVLRALLEQAYTAEGTAAASAAAPCAGSLARALGLQAGTASAEAAAAFPDTLAAGLRELRAKGSLCDLVLVAGGQRIQAHQAVLAAASVSLRRYIADGLERLVGASQEVISEPLELELEGVGSAEAVHAALEHAYAAPSAAEGRLPATEAAIRDVLRLALAFELTRLREQATQWLLQGVSTANAPERLTICDEFGFTALRRRIESLAAVASAAEGAEEEASSYSSPSSVQGKALEQPHVSPQELVLADLAVTARMTELECAALSTATARFADAKVPSRPFRHTADALQQSRTRQDARILERLRELFERRPVWLEGPLQRQLPAGLEHSTLLRLLPAVAYQWEGGPWHAAYARYGWDPRKHPEEAKWLQVLVFRDPFLRSPQGTKKVVRPGGDQAADCHFRRPPAHRMENYQLVDIKDDFVVELVRGSEPGPECSKKTGWLEQVVYDAARERLAVRSQQLRERLAAKEKAERAKKRAAKYATRGRAIGPRATKRARIGGA